MNKNVSKPGMSPVSTSPSAKKQDDKLGAGAAASAAPPRFDLDPIRRDAGYRLLSEAIKALTIVNGGAAVAALAFLGQLSQRFPLTTVMIRDAAIALAVLAFGTILAPSAAVAFAYNSYWPRNFLI